MSHSPCCSDVPCYSPVLQMCGFLILAARVWRGRLMTLILVLVNGSKGHEQEILRGTSSWLSCVLAPWARTHPLRFTWKLLLVSSQPRTIHVLSILLCPAWHLAGRWVSVCCMDEYDVGCHVMKKQSSFRVKFQSQWVSWSGKEPLKMALNALHFVTSNRGRETLQARGTS